MNKLARSHSTPPHWPRPRTAPLEHADSDVDEPAQGRSKSLDYLEQVECPESPPDPENNARLNELTTELRTKLTRLNVFADALVDGLREQTCNWTEDGTAAEILARYLEVPAIQHADLLPHLAQALGRSDVVMAGTSSLDKLLALLVSYERQHDPNGAKFLRFALRLLRGLDKAGAQQTVNESRALNRMLRHMSKDTGLRGKLFSECFSATESCDDRVLFHWIKLQDVWLSHAVDKGLHDKNPVAVAKRARQAFRQKFFLDWISRYVESLSPTDCGEVDLVEVYLAFLVELHMLLCMDGAAPTPLYRDGWNMGRIDPTSNIIQRAARELHRSENEEFLRFLAAWPPMRWVLSREFAERFEQLTDRLSSSSEEGAIRAQLKAELIQQSLQDQVSPSELEYQVTKRKAELFNQGVLLMVQDYFRAASTLLDPVWSVTVPGASSH